MVCKDLGLTLTEVMELPLPVFEFHYFNAVRRSNEKVEYENQLVELAIKLLAPDAWNEMQQQKQRPLVVAKNDKEDMSEHEFKKMAKEFRQRMEYIKEKGVVSTVSLQDDPLKQKAPSQKKEASFLGDKVQDRYPEPQPIQIIRGK